MLVVHATYQRYIFNIIWYLEIVNLGTRNYDRFSPFTGGIKRANINVHSYLFSKHTDSTYDIFRFSSLVAVGAILYIAFSYYS